MLVSGTAWSGRRWHASLRTAGIIGGRRKKRWDPAGMLTAAPSWACRDGVANAYESQAAMSIGQRAASSCILYPVNHPAYVLNYVAVVPTMCSISVSFASTFQSSCPHRSSGGRACEGIPYDLRLINVCKTHLCNTFLSAVSDSAVSPQHPMTARGMYGPPSILRCTPPQEVRALATVLKPCRKTPGRLRLHSSGRNAPPRCRQHRRVSVTRTEPLFSLLVKVEQGSARDTLRAPSGRPSRWPWMNLKGWTHHAVDAVLHRPAGGGTWGTPSPPTS